MISNQNYDLFLKNILEQIDCDWLIIGGSLLVLLRATNRATTDIDICPLSELTNDRRIQLMDVAQKSGLPIEAINPAADFFLRQIAGWKESLVLFKSGKNGNLYRPSISLYFRLKLSRGTETDIADCISFLNWHRDNNLAYEKDNLLVLLSNYDKSKVTPIAKELNR